MQTNQAANFKTEILAGITTFLTMSYIIVVNPLILSTEGTGLTHSGVLTATVLLSCLATLLMGLYAKIPFAVAPGMGLNAYFTYTLILGEKIPWPIALGIVFWSGVVFLIVSTTPLREKIALTIPENMKFATASGIGLFLAFIGLKNAQIIVAHPATFVAMGDLDMKAALVVGGLVLTLVLMRYQKTIAFLAGILLLTGISLMMGFSKMPEQVVAAPDFSSVMFKLDIWGALKLTFVPAILSVLFTDLFDSISTFVGVAKAGGLVDENGQPLRLKQGLVVDAIATFSAGLLGTSPGTAYIESSSGIEAGGRTGLTSVVTALCFLPFLFLAPLLMAVPAFATAPVLICIGLLMFKSIQEIKFENLEEWIPAVLTIVLIPLTFSIAKGLLTGLFFYVLLHLLMGRVKQLPGGLILLGVISGVLVSFGI